MSLLNDMLRDLSQHKPVVDGGEGYDEALLHASSITRKKQQSWAGLAIVFIVIFVAVLAINYFIHKFTGASKPVPENVKASHSNTDVSGSALVSSNTAASNTLSSNVVSSNIVSSNIASLKSTPVAPAKTEELKNTSQNLSDENTSNIELQNHIDDLLQQAERAIGMDRLTSPVEDNAFGYYQKILSMSANNVDAKEGLDKIANRYLIKAQEQIQLGNAGQAEALIQRARFVSARFVQAHEISLNGIDNPPVINASSVTEPNIPSQPIQTTTETIKPFVVAEASVVSVSPNAGWKDEQLAHHAQELIQQGKQTEALTQLKNFVATEQKPALSAALLADSYIQQGNIPAAEIVIDKTNYLPVDVKTKLKAQVLSLNGDDAQAIILLEKNAGVAEANEDYRSLLASLYHKTANYQQSIISYQRLINSFGEKPAYWLGLALAYDGLSQHKSALQAYQHLREYPQLQDQVRKYTDQRIAALRSE